MVIVYLHGVLEHIEDTISNAERYVEKRLEEEFHLKPEHFEYLFY